MAVAKRQGREKPVKIEQRKVRGQEWGPQVEQTAFLARPIYIGRARGEEKTYKKRSPRARFLKMTEYGLQESHVEKHQNFVFIDSKYQYM